MQNFELICSSQGNPKTGIQPSDSDVYKSSSDKKCYKFDPILSGNTIERYHKLHFLSQKKGEYTLQGNLSFTLEQLFGEKSNRNVCQINRVEFGVLELPKDIFSALDLVSKQNISVSEMEYIEGQNLRDLFFSSVNPQQRDFIEDLLKYMSIYYQQQFGLNMNHVSNYPGELNKTQLQGINIKIVGYQNGTLFLTITDLAKDIGEFVMNNKFLIYNIMN